ncbi:dihydrofolate reductase family protein [Streptomyces sp. 4N509B]|uniref:dihydrofolate reductase family protein n=1 Tax=Streptomyces sp. 4N509B TaxID=3457413 RepID=UPI003FD0ED8E
MGSLVYAGITSLDGYTADAEGAFDWAEPDEEVHAFINERERGMGVHLYGRRTYALMTAWETDAELVEHSPVARDFATSWQAAEKIVYSSTLPEVTTRRTRLERRFDPEEVRRLKESASTDLVIGGPTLAAHAVRAGLVDEYHLYVQPVIVGGGLPYLPQDARVPLVLLEERRFASGVVHLRYAAA